MNLMSKEHEKVLSILQINMQKQLDNQSILPREKPCHNIDIIAIQEPAILPFSSKGNWKTHNPDTANFDTYMPNSDTAPLVCFFINRHTLDKTKISIIERAGLLVLLDTEVEANEEWRKISIHNVYNPCQHQNNRIIENGPFMGLPTESAISHLEIALKSREDRENIVLGGFNLWHKEWFGNISTRGRQNTYSRRLAKQMPTKKSDTTKGTTIDLVWTSEFIWSGIIECGVSRQHECESDHLPVLTNIVCKRIPTPSTTRPLLKQIDKDIFEEALKREMTLVTAATTREDLDDIISRIIKALQKAVQELAPIANVTPRSYPGLSEAAREAIRHYKAQRKLW
ncbi:hypothetical protein K3495_g6477 [Podosphaera aphanis]|nr:hypothetical protein K3495_g6477 [Podosphaera aphanis]